MLAAGEPAPGLRTLQTHLARGGLNGRADERAGGWPHPGERLRALRGVGARRALDRGRAARPEARGCRATGRAAWVHRRPLAAAGRLAVGHRRGCRVLGGGAAAGALGAWGARGDPGRPRLGVGRLDHRRGAPARRRVPRGRPLPLERRDGAPRSACCRSASRACAGGCGSGRSPRSSSGSACATRSPAWSSRSPPRDPDDQRHPHARIKRRPTARNCSGRSPSQSSGA